MSRVKNLVTAEWLIENHGRSDVKICDATYFLVTHNRDAKAEYLACDCSHLTGGRDQNHRL